MSGFCTSARTEALMEVCGTLFYLGCFQNMMRPSQKQRRKENTQNATFMIVRYTRISSLIPYIAGTTNKTSVICVKRLKVVVD